MTRTASCQCGGFRVTAEGEPDVVNICHCRACQRRTGVPLTCNAYFHTERVSLDGDYRLFTRDGQDGRKLHNHFCPTCGATVCWRADMRPDHYGVAVGAFSDPDFPAPTYSVWEEAMCAWVTLPAGLAHFPQART